MPAGGSAGGRATAGVAAEPNIAGFNADESHKIRTGIGRINSGEYPMKGAKDQVKQLTKSIQFYDDNIKAASRDVLGGNSYKTPEELDRAIQSAKNTAFQQRHVEPLTRMRDIMLRKQTDERKLAMLEHIIANSKAPRKGKA